MLYINGLGFQPAKGLSYRRCPITDVYCFLLNIRGSLSFAGSGGVKSLASSSQTWSRSACERSASFLRVATVRKHFGQIESNEPSGFRLWGNGPNGAVSGIAQPLSILKLDACVIVVLCRAAFPDKHSEVVRGRTEFDQFPLSELEINLQILSVRLLFDQKYQVFKDLSRPHHPFMKLPAATVICPVVTILHSSRPHHGYKSDAGFAAEAVACVIPFQSGKGSESER